ncbi:Alpha/Beta hydrolase protein [Scheffersomyces coipomensis]|uniref:Alpha/Beta hydrolase protein n=1 Tax=Scheffersomyces coipomensis TaxID=1788519 RepID=UPI00315CD9BD
MGILGWGFRATLKVHQSDDEKSIQLKTKDHESLTFSQFIKNNLPIVDPSKKLWLSPWLFNGALQTLYYTSADTSKKFLIYYGRELFTYKDGGICSLDWVIPPPEDKEEFKRIYKETLPEGFPRLHPRTRYFTKDELESKQAINQDQDSTKPIVVIVHGLAGGSHEPLIRNLAESIHDKTSGGWDTMVINSRGCCRTKITTEKLFSALSIGDVKEVLVEIKKRYPTRPIYAVGFSFGCVLLANLMGSTEKEESDDDLIKACSLIGCPWDLVDSGHHLESSWSGAYLFSPALSQFLGKIVKNNYKDLNSHNSSLFNEDSLKQCLAIKKLYQFDDLFTCKTIGLANAFEYYKAGSPKQRMGNIKTPTLIVNATDDPAVGIKLPIKEVEANPYLAMVESDLGGHLGFVQSSGKFWCVEVVEQFFANFDTIVQ